jgi:hypothetical protein
VIFKFLLKIFWKFLSTELLLQKQIFEAISHLKSTRIVAQEILNYLSITLNKSDVFNWDYYPEVIGRVIGMKDSIWKKFFF